MSFNVDSLTVDTTSAPQAMIRRLPNGTFDLVAPDPNERETRVVPGPGTYTLRFSGFTEPFEVDDNFNPGERKTVIRVEFTVVRGKNLTGRHFSNRWTWTFGERATLGTFARRLVGGDLPAMFNLTSLLDAEFEAMVNPDGKEKYADIVVKSVIPTSAVEIEQPATRDQIAAIIDAAKQVYDGNQSVAVEKIRVYIKAAFNANSSVDLTYEQADTVQNFLETTPHDDIIAKIDEYANTADTYSEVPF